MDNPGDQRRDTFLVTGGAGFIGSHLTELLLETGKQVVILDDFSTGSLDNISHLASVFKGLNVVQGNILDKPLVDAITREVDCVFHLGAAVGVARIMEKPIESLKINIEGTENLLQASFKFKKRFLLTSSSEIYGKNTCDSLSENSDRILGSPEKFRWLYSEAKAIDETVTMIYHAKGMDTRIVRLFNTVGPRQSHRYGMVLPNFVRSALVGQDLEIYGDGNQTRCFVHVKDVVQALNLVMNSYNSIGATYNVGSPSEVSINELAHLVLSLSNSNSRIVHREYEAIYRNGFEDMQRRVPDINKIKKELGWSPEQDLREIIVDTIEHERRKLEM
jgi:UDP-glucose 4-epimerase